MGESMSGKSMLEAGGSFTPRRTQHCPVKSHSRTRLVYIVRRRQPFGALISTLKWNRIVPPSGVGKVTRRRALPERWAVATSQRLSATATGRTGWGNVVARGLVAIP